MGFRELQGKKQEESSTGPFRDESETRNYRYITLTTLILHKSIDRWVDPVELCLYKYS